VSSEDSVDSVECGADIGHVGDQFRLVAVVAIRSSETSVLIRATRRHLPEDDNHQSPPWKSQILHRYNLHTI
jgi:hypothetical protein